MKRKIIINPEFTDLSEFVSTIPNRIQHEGTVVQDRRNLIKTISFKDNILNVKRYRIPILVNRIFYTFFRKTKAFRAFYNAFEVRRRGFETPKAIAYIEEKTNGLLSYSYFISDQIHNFTEIREYYHSKVKGDEDILKSFAKYTARLHEAEILHLDYSPGNLLINKNDSKVKFSLVDINRMRFGKIGMTKGCSNFARIFKYDDTVIYIVTIYAKERNFDISECVKIALEYKHRYERKKERKKKIKQFFNIYK